MLYCFDHGDDNDYNDDRDGPADDETHLARHEQRTGAKKGMRTFMSFHLGTQTG